MARFILVFLLVSLLPGTSLARVHHRSNLTDLSKLPPELRSKVQEIVTNCKSRVVALNAGHSRNIAGTKRISLHKLNRAADLAGNARCIYARLKGWPGGYSIDYNAVKHVHISLDRVTGREMGYRFAHYSHRRHNIRSAQFSLRREANAIR